MERAHLQIRLGPGWSPGGTLSDDSKRFSLYRDANAELDRVRKLLQSPSAAKNKAFILSQVERVKQLGRHVLEIKPPRGSHFLVARLIDLDESVPDQAAVKGLVASGRAAWIAAPATKR
jgi:hypothetical protein